MNRHPIEMVTPIFRWLDWIIATYGVHIYLVAVWAAPFLIAWILSGGFWRTRPRIAAVRRVMPLGSALPPPLPPSTEANPQSRRSTDGDIQWFAARAQ